jgi:hypothetical protein
VFRVGGAWRFRREERNQCIAEKIGKRGVRTHETTERGRASLLFAGLAMLAALSTISASACSGQAAKS